MPYTIRKVPNKSCYRIINRKTGKLKSRCSTKKNAMKQMRLLHSLEKKRKRTMKGGVNFNPRAIYVDATDRVKELGNNVGALVTKGAQYISEHRLNLNRTSNNPPVHDQTSDNPTSNNPSVDNPTSNNPPVDDPTSDNPTSTNPPPSIDDSRTIAQTYCTKKEENGEGDDHIVKSRSVTGICGLGYGKKVRCYGTDSKKIKIGQDLKPYINTGTCKYIEDMKTTATGVGNAAKALVLNAPGALFGN